jgi:hypothetical protein
MSPKVPSQRWLELGVRDSREQERQKVEKPERTRAAKAPGPKREEDRRCAASTGAASAGRSAAYVALARAERPCTGGALNRPPDQGSWQATAAWAKVEGASAAEGVLGSLGVRARSSFFRPPLSAAD